MFWGFFELFGVLLLLICLLVFFGMRLGSFFLVICGCVVAFLGFALVGSLLLLLVFSGFEFCLFF